MSELDTAACMIVLKSVSKSFRTRRKNTLALSDTSLQVGRDEIVSVVGPSGCGKTTLLNLIAGYTQPSSGYVAMAGRPITGPSFDRAVVFQSDAVFPWLTVLKNVAYGLRIRGVPKSEWIPRVRHYLDIVGLTEFADSYPKELSGGMRKRVDLARAYASGPDVLLLDEPFGALDIFTKEAMWLALQHVWQTEPKTVVFVTHDIEEALFVGDRVLVMTSRPARVHEEISVPFARPRALDLRAEPVFQNMRMHISKTLREVAGDGS